MSHSVDWEFVKEMAMIFIASVLYMSLFGILGWLILVGI